MTAVVIVGAQWGDEGKGKVVDMFAEQADMVVRYAGGPNAGHTLLVGQEKTIVRLIPSGILHANTQCVLGQGMVIDPHVLVNEIDQLNKSGRQVEQSLAIAERAHLIFPYHILVDSLREQHASAEKAIGTTKKGIGPTYEDKAARRGITMSCLRSEKRLRQGVEQALEAWAPTIRALGGDVPSVEAMVEPVLGWAKRLVPLLADTSAIVDKALKAKKKVMFEGAQGTLLDIDHGTYPFVTSSSAIAGGATTGVGVGPTRLDHVVGITKAYLTRVGGGPFPTELNDARGEHLQKVGGEFGSVTGRPRRTGWLDLPAMRYSARVNGLDSLAITKLDVLSGLADLEVCIAYDTPQGRTEEFPLEQICQGEAVTPVYKRMAGWQEPMQTAKKLEDLPKQARSYLDLIEQHVGVKISLVSVGARRDETIVLFHPLTHLTIFECHR
jgi:adenylosuccinate synthase